MVRRSTPRRPSRCSTAAGFPTASRPRLHYRDTVRSYLPNPTQRRARTSRRSSKTNLGIDAASTSRRHAPTSTTPNAGKLDGMFLLGWGADYPDVTNFLDDHFGAGAHASVRRAVPDIARPSTTGATTADQASRNAGVHRGQQRSSRARPDGPDRPRRLRRRVSGRRPGRPLVAARQRAVLGHDPGRSPPARVHAERRAGRPLLRRRDATARRSAPASRSSSRSTATRSVASTVEPALATECEPNADLTRGPASSRRREVPRRLDARRQRRGRLVRRPVGRRQSAPQGPDRHLRLLLALFGGFLNPPVPKPTAPSRSSTARARARARAAPLGHRTR